MTVPTAEELIGGFWGGGYSSGPMDAYALAAYLIGRNAAGIGVDAPLRGWQVRADERVSPGLDGRPTYGYPAPTPGGDPVWVAYDFSGGAVLAAGPDFTVSDGYVWFETDPVHAATVRGHVWTDDGPIASAYLLWSPGRPAPAEAAYPDGTYAALVDAVSAACDSPASGPNTEVVEAVWLGPDDRWRVVTDAAAYRLPAADTPGVTAGTTLPPFSPLGSAWRLYRLGVPYPALDRVVVPAAFLPDSDVTGPIAFYNHNVATVVDTADDRTRVRFPVGALDGPIPVCDADMCPNGGPGTYTVVISGGTGGYAALNGTHTYAHTTGDTWLITTAGFTGSAVWVDWANGTKQMQAQLMHTASEAFASWSGDIVAVSADCCASIAMTFLTDFDPGSGGAGDTPNLPLLEPGGTCDCAGYAADADAFWAAGHTWGVGDGGRTLAEALDTRADPQTEPIAADLPTSVNPFELACRLVFNGAAYLLVVDTDYFGPAAETDSDARAESYRTAVGPHTAVIEWTGGDQPEPTEVTPA